MDKHDLTEQKSTSRKPWLVFGEALVDQFPEAIVTGGAPFNVARHLAGFGAPVLFVSCVGGDAYGDVIRAEMQRLGMSTKGLQTDAAHPTGTVRVEQSADGAHTFHILNNQAYDYIDAVKLLPLLDEMGAEFQLYHGTLALRSSVSRSACAALCAQPHKGRFVDMNWREGQLTHAAALAALQGAQWVKLSEAELALCLSWLSLDSQMSKQVPELHEHCIGLAALMQQLGVTTLLVTYGEEGSAVFTQGACIAVAASVPVKNLRDTVGAGDAFSAVCMLAQNEGWGWPTTLARASAFAAAVCGIRGAAPASADFYKDWTQQWQLNKT
jgi:fructokinase